MKQCIFIIVIATLLATICTVCAYGITRYPAVAGKFYPGDSIQLSNMVSNHLANVSELPEIDGRILALIVPHAGLVYSGQIAAYSYKLLEKSDINRVILCGPSHRYRFDGLSVYGPYVTWETPLGKIDCNNSLCDQLINFDRGIELYRQAHTQEHCLEVQLPYLQSVLGAFEIVPIAMGVPDKSMVMLLANALKSLDFDNQTIMVASTDWQHYRPASQGWPMDSLGIFCLENLDPDRLLTYLNTGQVEMCGGGSAVAILKAAIDMGADKVKILKYGDSGDIAGDKSSVVSYVSAVIYDSENTAARDKNKTDPEPLDKDDLPQKFELSKSDREVLLNIARRSIENYLTAGEIPDFEVSENLNKFGAAFVTLEKQGYLRGCIGHTTAVEPLYKTVANCAVQAAVSDPRFPPVKAAELSDIHIEISVLSSLQTVKSLNEIEVGRDGLMIFKGSRRGLLLPQVATEYGWDRTTFLEQTCRKAGLFKDDYKSSDAVIYKFQAVIFGE